MGSGIMHQRVQIVGSTAGTEDSGCTSMQGRRKYVSVPHSDSEDGSGRGMAVGTSSARHGRAGCHSEQERFTYWKGDHEARPMGSQHTVASAQL